MNKIGLIITINKFNHWFETTQVSFSCENIDDTKNNLVDYLVTQFKNLNIDYPLDFADFEYAWFKQQYVNTNAFYYKVFMENSWHEPWDQQDIYSEVLDKMFEQETQNPPDFTNLYGEPDPDEEVNDKFDNIEENELINELEKKLTNIIKESKNVHFKEDTVKECKCEKCQEGALYQNEKNYVN